MTPQKINRITLGLLTLGLGTALAIFLTAAPEVVDPLLGDQFADKKYLREMRVIGYDVDSDFAVAVWGRFIKSLADSPCRIA